MAWSEEIMAQARVQVALRSKSVPHKIATLAWYTGRKKLRGAPRTAVTKAGSLIPVPLLGSVVNTAIETAITKIDRARKAKKQARYREAASDKNLESLRQSSKADAKALKDIAEKIDTNQPKLKDASMAFITALQTYANACATGVPTKDQVWNVALALYERERYEDKILVLVEVARELLDAVEKYVEKSRNQTAKLEEDFVEELDALEEDIIEDSQKPPSPTGYGPLK